MTDRQQLVDLLVRHEGLKLTVYADSLGVPTIGVGRNLKTKGITSGEAFYLLDHDIDEAIHDLASFSWFAALDPIRQRALTDMRFNLGPTRFRNFSQMLHAVAIGDYQQAADQMLQSRWASQVKDRAKELAAMMRTGTE